VYVCHKTSQVWFFKFLLYIQNGDSITTLRTGQNSELRTGLTSTDRLFWQITSLCKQ